MPVVFQNECTGISQIMYFYAQGTVWWWEGVASPEGNSIYISYSRSWSLLFRPQKSK